MPPLQFRLPSLTDPNVIETAVYRVSNVFTRPSVPFTTEVGVPCPFEDQMCASPAVTLDSGLIDLNDALGMNLDDASRVRYRKKTTCAILPHEGYTRIAHSSDDPQELPRAGDFYDEEVIQWLYGRTLRDGIHASNWTFGQSLLVGNATSTFGKL
jgi:hypothetical protein